MALGIRPGWILGPCDNLLTGNTPGPNFVNRHPPDGRQFTACDAIDHNGPTRFFCRFSPRYHFWILRPVGLALFGGSAIGGCAEVGIRRNHEWCALTVVDRRLFLGGKAENEAANINKALCIGRCGMGE
jgi:hypothetical protein